MTARSPPGPGCAPSEYDGGIGGAAAAVAAGSAFDGPIGAAVGAVVGFFTWGINALIDKVTDRKHKIARLRIG